MLHNILQNKENESNSSHPSIYTNIYHFIMNSIPITLGDPVEWSVKVDNILNE